MKYRRRSNMVAPGMTPTPPTTTRVGMPSVWESTAWNTRRATHQAQSRCQRLLGGAADDGLAARASAAARGGRHGPP